MELLIPGLILVAVMVWASTRIKKTAAAAFDAETVETEAFSLQKSEGWLAKVEPAAGLLFEAYSKEFGKNEAENIRLGTANVATRSGTVPDAARELLKGATPIEDLREVVDEINYRVVTVEREEDGVQYRDFLKLAAKNGTVYTLTVRSLVDATDEFRSGVEGMVDSFVLK